MMKIQYNLVAKYTDMYIYIYEVKK